MTLLADKLRAAGLVPAPERLAEIIRGLVRNPPPQAAPQDWSDPAADERLKEVALNAVRQSPRNWDGARDALFKAVRNDAALLWALFEPYRNQAAQAALTAAASELRREQMAREGQGRAGQRSNGDRQLDARPSIKPSDAGASAVAAAASRSILDTFRVNGRPLGDCTAREAAAWAKSYGAKARFVEAVVANLPPDDPVRRWRTAEEAEAIHASLMEGADAE